MTSILLPKTTIFQDDNLPVHTAKKVRSWFEEHRNISIFPGQHNRQISTSLSCMRSFEAENEEQISTSFIIEVEVLVEEWSNIL